MCFQSYLRQIVGVPSQTKGNRDPWNSLHQEIKGIMELLPPRNLRELYELQRRLVYIRRLISNLSGISKLTKKGVAFEWDEQYQNR